MFFAQKNRPKSAVCAPFSNKLLGTVFSQLLDVAGQYLTTSHFLRKIPGFLRRNRLSNAMNFESFLTLLSDPNVRLHRSPLERKKQRRRRVLRREQTRATQGAGSRAQEARD